MKKTLLFMLLPLLCILLQAQETVVIDGVTFSVDKKTLIKYSADKADEEYVVPEGTEIISEYAFLHNCHLQVLTLPLSLKEIGDRALAGSVLKTIIWKNYPAIVGYCIWELDNTHPSDLSSFLTTEKSDNCISVDGVLYSKDKKKLLGFPPAKIGNRLSGKYEVPEGTEVITQQAFAYADIAEVILPSTLNRIEEDAFSVRWLVATGNYPDADALINVFCKAVTPPEVIENPFISPFNIDLYVPEESADIYRNTDYWKLFITINGKSNIPLTNQSSNLESWIENDILYIECDETMSKIKAYDTKGTCFWQVDIHENKWQMATGEFPKGVLLLEVTTSGGKSTEIKLLN